MTNIIQSNNQQKKVYFYAMYKLQKSQELKARIIPYIQEHYPHIFANPNRKQRISECCNMVAFRRYAETWDVKLVSSNFCKYDRICVACATKRAMIMIKKFKQGIQDHNLYHKKRYYIVLTISHKQWDQLTDLMTRLMEYKDKLARAYRNSKRQHQTNKSFFAQFDGMVISIEIAHSGKHWRHPHINILACSDHDILIESKYKRGQTNPQLLNEWKTLTNGTSYIHNIRKIEVSQGHFTRRGIWEVFKYAIKFSDLSVEQLAEVMSAQHVNQYRFFATYGIFRWWKLAQWSTYEGDWSEGVFLYDEESKQYEIQNNTNTTIAGI